MTGFLPRRYFLYGGLSIPFLVEARCDDSELTLRTWKLSADAALQNLAPAAELAENLQQRLPPFVIDHDPFGWRRAGRDLWLPLAALGGIRQHGLRDTNLYVQPISQLRFGIDPLLLGRGAWSDHAVWSFNASDSGRLELPFNRYLLSRESKAHTRFVVAGQASPILLLYVPFAGDSFDHCSFVLQYNAAVGCVHDMPDPRPMPVPDRDWQHLTAEQQFGVKGLLPVLHLAGADSIAAGTAADFTLELRDPESGALIPERPVQVWLDSDAGYLPQRRIAIAGGAAGFRLQALGLAPGDRIKLKAGWRHYSGAAEKIVTVV